MCLTYPTWYLSVSRHATNCEQYKSGEGYPIRDGMLRLARGRGSGVADRDRVPGSGRSPRGQVGTGLGRVRSWVRCVLGPRPPGSAGSWAQDRVPGAVLRSGRVGRSLVLYRYTLVLRGRREVVRDGGACLNPNRMNNESAISRKVRSSERPTFAVTRLGVTVSVDRRPSVRQ